MKITYNGIELDVEKAEIIAWSAEPQNILADKLSSTRFAEGMHLNFSSVELPAPDGRCRVRLTLRKKEP